MEKAHIPANERERIEALKEYAILDTLPESDFDAITRLASTICDVPVSLITFIGEHKQTFKSRYGTDIKESPRDISFCSHAILSDDIMIVPDAREDRRFHDNPVIEKLDAIFYAGVPLVNPDGYALGTLCVADNHKRYLTNEQEEAIRLLANQVVKLLELRRKNAELQESKNAYKSLFEQNPDAVFSFGLNGRFLSANEALLQMVETSVEELRRTTFARYVSTPYINLVTQSFRNAARGNPQNYNVELISAKGKRLMVNITNIPNLSNGKIIGVYGIAKDITEKHKLQENLSMILNNTRESFMIVDRKLNIVFFNESASQGARNMMNMSISKGMNILDMAEPTRVSELIRLYNKVFEGEISESEIPVSMAEGETMWVSNSYSPVIDPDGEINHVIVTTIDITEKKKAQLKLEKSELGLKQAQQISQIGNWEIDLVHLKSYWSDEMFRILGFVPGDIEPTLRNYLDTIHPEDVDNVARVYIEQTQYEESHISTHRIVHPDGEIRYVYAESKFILENGNPVGLYGVLHDITDKHKSTEQLRSSEQKTRLIMNAALDAIIWIDPAGMITFWNPQSENTFGWKKEEALGRNLIDLIAPESAHSLYLNAISNYMEKGEETALNVMVEQSAVNKEGVEFPIELTVIPIRQNAEITFCVFIRNISERKRFSDELRLSEKRYRDLFYLSPLPMWVYDLETLEFLDVNDAAVRHYGYSYDEFMHMTLDEIRPEDELGSFEKAVNFVKKSVVFHRGDFRHMKKNGDIIDVDVQSNMIDYAGRDARLILAIDITRERENERKLKNMTQSLEQKVIERTLELNQANQLLSYEHQQTRDSITYAQNIQSSILHRENDLQAEFMDSFVFFKPKDKVSGDFFWCHETDEHYLIAVVDCTGHGVPGAMISMVGFQLLNQIVLINGETSPAAVLNQLDHEVNSLFHQNKEESAVDGMDMVFCKISKHENELCFAGAQRPLFVVNAGGLQEIKGSKLAIGGHTRYRTEKAFTEHSVKFESGDCVYLTSDGYYSQFGGPNDKIMLKKRLKLKLSEIAGLPADAQGDALKEYFESWRGNEEQVDDVLVVGLKMK